MGVVVGSAEILEDTGCICRARVVAGSTAPIVKTDVASFTRHIFDEDSTSPNTALTTVSVTSPTTAAIHATLQTSGWGEDAVGYNFENAVHPSSVVFAKPNRRYRVEYSFTPASPGVPRFKALFRAVTKGVRGS